MTEAGATAHSGNYNWVAWTKNENGGETQISNPKTKYHGRDYGSRT